MFKNFTNETFFTHIQEIPENEPCALHSCLTAVADLFERPLYGGPKDPEFEKTIPEGCDFPPIHEDDCRRYAEEHHLIFELSMDDDFNCIAVYIEDGDWHIGVCSDREVELYEEEKAKKKDFVESVLSKLEEQAGHKVSMSQDEVIAYYQRELDNEIEESIELNNKYEELRHKNEELNELVQSLNTFVNELKHRQAMYRDENEVLKEALEAKEQELDKLKQENFELQEALELTEQELDKALRQVAGFKTSDAYFKSRIEEAERLKKENLDMGMQVMRANIRAQKIADSYEKLKADTCDYEYLLKENEKLIKANEEYRSENVLLKNHVANIASQIEELEKEVHSITKRKHSA